MIRSKEDYLFYLEADRLAYKFQEQTSLREKLNRFLFPDLVWDFQVLLRQTEYFTNCRKDFFGKSYAYFLQFKFSRLSYKLGFTIRLNTIGPGLRIGHYPQVIVQERARIGENCFLHQGVTIGRNPGNENAPQIGNNVYIGAGAKVIGDIQIADGVVIGANAVVVRSITEPNITVGGVPAKKLSDTGSSGMLVDAANIIRQRKVEKK
jgi:serine O-acetyltransferase